MNSSTFCRYQNVTVRCLNAQTSKLDSFFRKFCFDDLQGTQSCCRIQEGQLPRFKKCSVSSSVLIAPPSPAWLPQRFPPVSDCLCPLFHPHALVPLTSAPGHVDLITAYTPGLNKHGLLQGSIIKQVLTMTLYPIPY